MPLSEEELRLLEQMERALVEEDPKFASTLRGTSLRSSARRRAIIAGVCFVIGVVVMMGGAISEIYPVAVGGFVIMLASATIGVTALRARNAPAAAPQSGEPHDESSGFTLIQGGRPGRPRRPRQSSSGSFIERMEERWRRRRESGGF